MKPIFLIIIVSFPFFSFAQEYFASEKPTVIYQFSYFKSTDSTFTVEKKEIGSNYVVTIGGTDSLEITHFFKPDNDTTDYDFPICDSVTMKLYCERCVEAHILRQTTKKTKKWYKIDDSHFVSGKWVQSFNSYGKSPKIYTVPVMFIDKNSEPVTISISGKEYTKKEWKAVLKSGTKMWK